MKRIGIFKLLTIATALLLTSFSCEDNDSKVTYLSALGEFEKVSSTEYYIDTDKDNKFHVLNAMELVQKGIKPDDRILAYFYEESANTAERSKYDADITVTDCVTIPIKKPVLLTEENKDKLGDDRVSVIGFWFGKDYLNFQYRFSASGSIKHEINLVDIPNPEVNKPGYKYYEIRHNSHKDTGHQYYSGIISFDLSDFRDQNPDLTGIVVGVTYGKGETKLFELKFGEEEDDDDDSKFKANALEANRLTE